jgi:hypothetical protein
MFPSLGNNNNAMSGRVLEDFTKIDKIGEGININIYYPKFMYQYKFVN